MIVQIRKRDGTITKFNKDKIANAIYGAAREAGGESRLEIAAIADKVLEKVESEMPKGSIPTVEGIQDIVEQVLIETGHAKTAKAYIIYRQKRAELRTEKKHILEKDEIDEVDKKFDPNALKVLKARYLRKDESGKLIETPKQLFTRVATHVALPELLYDERVFTQGGTPQDYEEFEAGLYDGEFSIGSFVLNKYHLEALKRTYDRFNRNSNIKVSWTAFLELLKNGSFNVHEKALEEFYQIMINKQFMPNTPAIANFGSVLGLGSACFVLGIDDNLESIMDTLKYTALIHQAGGGTGYNFSKLRPEGDVVKSTCGAASGPLSFMNLYDSMTDVIKQGGMRRGANMGIMNSNHPDIEKFITAKEGNKALRNFNISVLIMDDFWKYYEKDEPYPLVNPRNNKTVRTVSPRMLFDKIVYQAWESAEPGVIFFDRINEFNPFLKHLGPIVTTNPCVAADTLVSTERGLERIDSMKTDKITIDSRTTSQASDLLYTQIGCRTVQLVNRVKTGYKDCYKIETNSGYEVTATPDHKILTTGGWKQVQDISEDDSILIQSGEGKFNSDDNLPFDVKNEVTGANGRIYRFNLPTKWSRELGILLGWLTGDGWINYETNQVGLVFAKEDEEAKKIIQPIFEKYCNREIKEMKYPNGCVQLRSSSKHVINFLKNLGVTKQREVPSSLFVATEEAVLGFLEGLFSSDGTIAMGTKSRNYVRLNSSSLKLLKDVQKILLNLGIRTSIYDRSTNSKIFRYTKKSGEIIKYKTSGENYELNISKINLLNFVQKMSFIQNKNKQKIVALQKFEFYKERFADKVKSKEFAGKREVWDITEPQTHSFIANGIIVHNCGEVLLYPNEPCNLGSINVWAFVRENESGDVYVDWDQMQNTIRVATRFMDNVIDINRWPLKQIEDMALATRKVGFGVMGLGDMLFELGLPYDDDDGRAFMEQLMEFINYWTKVESVNLAKERGPMPYLDKSFYPEGRLPFAGATHKNARLDWASLTEEIKKYGIRNGYTTIIAPTGSISMIAGCSSGMEPVYSLVFEKNVKVGSFYYIDPVFEKVMRRHGLYDEDLMKQIAENRGSIRNVPYISQRLKKVFVTAMDVTPENHIRALAAFQKWVDSSISKTNNFPANATVDDMRQSYMLAYQLGCKGVTVFRDSSIKEQVLVAPTREHVEEVKKERYVAIKETTTETSEGTLLQHKTNGKYVYTNCPTCKSTAISFKEGCVTCDSCGWGLCS
ncbi:MAG: ribonucleotide-diphosphate reductase subunit alpha [Parcubacteria group bacterium GW2011_GWC2_45_7]|nr:MAG: ribonucleotide-diphosphate reductase subunit alpha [Parcubacteria group bacterium GW2011_GWC2_45_7]